MFGQIRWGVNLMFAAYKWMLVGSILYFLFLCLLVKIVDKKTTTSHRLKQCLVFSAFFIVPFLLVPVLAWRPRNLKNLGYNYQFLLNMKTTTNKQFQNMWLRY
jgi:ABC-type Mn2+/Zn2+ transport system permease subunit